MKLSERRRIPTPFFILIILFMVAGLQSSVWMKRPLLKHPTKADSRKLSFERPAFLLISGFAYHHMANFRDAEI